MHHDIDSFYSQIPSVILVTVTENTVGIIAVFIATISTTSKTTLVLNVQSIVLSAQDLQLAQIVSKDGLAARAKRPAGKPALVARTSLNAIPVSQVDGAHIVSSTVHSVVSTFYVKRKVENV